MKKYLLMTAGLAAIMLSHTGASAQDDAQAKIDTTDNPKQVDEIIIIRKNNKDAKVNVEIKDGKVYINGKPSEEYKDGNVTIRRRKIGRGGAFAYNSNSDDFDFYAPAAPGAVSPFRNHSGALSFDNDVWDRAMGAGTRAFLGVTSETDEDQGGARITEISKGSAAEKTGLKKGDVITKIEETKIESPEELSSTIRKFKPEDKVTVTYKRDGKEQKATAVLGKTKSATFKAITIPNFDNLEYGGPRTFGYGEAYGPKGKLGIKAQDTEDGKGVKVLDVNDESPAERAGIKEGDIITKFDGKDVENASALAAMARANKDKASVKINLIRDGKPMEIEVKTPKKLRTADL